MTSATSSLPSLTQWLQIQLTGHFVPNDTQQEERARSFDATFASNAEIFYNHQKMTAAEYKEQMQEHFTAGTTLEWGGLFEILSETEHGGIVAGSLVVTRTMKFRIRAAPAQRKSYITLSAKVELDAENEAEDKRRIVQLFLTSVDKGVSVLLPEV